MFGSIRPNIHIANKEGGAIAPPLFVLVKYIHLLYQAAHRFGSV